MRLIGYMDPQDLEDIDPSRGYSVTVSAQLREGQLQARYPGGDSMKVYVGEVLNQDAGDMASFQAHVDDNWNSRRFQDPRREIGNDRYEELRQDFIMVTGLAGECGETVELLKKWVRDGELDRGELLLELGDILRYLTRIASRHGFSLAEVAQANVDKIDIRNKHGKAVA